MHKPVSVQNVKQTKDQRLTGRASSLAQSLAHASGAGDELAATLEVTIRSCCR